MYLPTFLKARKLMALLLIRLLLLARIAGVIVSLLASSANRKRGLPAKRLWRWLGGVPVAVLIIMVFGIYLIARDIH